MLARPAAQYARRSVTHAPLQTLRGMRAHASQSRSFLTGHMLSQHWMKRAKILHIIGRMAVAYPQMHGLSDPNAPINRLFARDSSERERAFMFVLSQIAPDEPVDLSEFVRGASNAASTVVSAIHHNSDLVTVESMATEDCIAVWKKRKQHLMQLLKVADDATLLLDGVEVRHAGVAEVKYSYTDARRDQQDLSEAARENERADANPSTRPTSKFMMHEAIQIQIELEVREHLRMRENCSVGTQQERAVAVDSSFAWTFESDVSTADVVDWVITATTPFTSTIVSSDGDVDKAAQDKEHTAE